MKNMEQEKMTKEEMQKLSEAKQKEFQEFLQSLKDDPDSPCTKGELAKTIELFVQDMQGIGEMAGAAFYNVQMLGQNFNALVNVIQGGPPPVQKTKSGIIFP